MKYILTLLIMLIMVFQYAISSCNQTDEERIDLRVLIVEDKGFPAVPVDHLIASVEKVNYLLKQVDVRLNLQSISHEKISTFMESIWEAGLSQDEIEKAVVGEVANGLEDYSTKIVNVIKESIKEAVKDSDSSQLGQYWYLGSSFAWDYILSKLKKYDMVVINTPIFEQSFSDGSKKIPAIYEVEGIGKEGRTVLSYAFWFREKKNFPSYSDKSDYYISSIIIHEILHSFFNMSHRLLYQYDVMNPLYRSKIYFQTKPLISNNSVKEIKSMQVFKKAKDYFDQKRIVKAQEYLRRSLEIMPENVSALELKSKILMSKDKLEDKKKLDKSIAELKAQNELLNETARRMANNYSLGTEARYTGEVEKATEYYKAVLTENLEVLSKEEVLADLAYRTLIELADMYSLQNDYNKAVATVEKLLKYWPDDSEALYILGKSYYNKGSYEQGLKYLNDYLEMGPEGVKAETARIFIENITSQIDAK